MSKISFQEESFHDVIEEIKPILNDNWRELDIYQDKIELNPDYSKYGIMYDNGMLKIFTVRKDEELIGYFIIMMINHLHHKDHLFALTDVIFIKKEFRNAGIGRKFIQFVEEELSKIGISVLLINTKEYQSFGSLLKSMEYDCVERAYSKYIGDK